MAIDSRTQADYLQQLQALLPPGAAWPREAGATLTRVLAALADGLARADARVDALCREMEPRSAVELIAEWERNYGLPEPCLAPAETLAERQHAAHEKVTRFGGQCPDYFIRVAKSLGYTVTIKEWHPFRMGDALGGDLSDDEYHPVWRVNAPETTIRYFRAGHGTAGARLREWGNEMLECVLRRLKPAHTILQFGYGG